jgi:hypothetical protein
MAGVRDEEVARFVETTGCDTDQATFLLEATHGNFESAVQMYYGAWVATTNTAVHQHDYGPVRGSCKQCWCPHSCFCIVHLQIATLQRQLHVQQRLSVAQRSPQQQQDDQQDKQQQGLGSAGA